MSRAYSGKTSISALSWRIAVFMTIPYLFIVWVFYTQMLGGDTFATKILWLAIWWIFLQAGGFIGLFPVLIVMRVVYDLIYHNSAAYALWIREGGSPFWDVLPWPINTDAPKVRMAISRPPDYDLCPRDGWPLGRRFGNQCRYCGLYYDKG